MTEARERNGKRESAREKGRRGRHRCFRIIIQDSARLSLSCSFFVISVVMLPTRSILCRPSPSQLHQLVLLGLSSTFQHTSMHTCKFSASACFSVLCAINANLEYPHKARRPFVFLLISKPEQSFQPPA